MKNLTSRKGFTLIELLIVITIIGILAVALLPSVLGAPARARDAARKADLNNIIAAIETFNSDKQHYPSDEGQICISQLKDGGTAGILDGYFQGGKPPADPQGKTYTGAAAGTGCDGYVYSAGDGNPVSYIVASYMEITGDGNVKATDFKTATDSLVNKTSAKTLQDAISPGVGNVYAVIK